MSGRNILVYPLTHKWLRLARQKPCSTVHFKLVVTVTSPMGRKSRMLLTRLQIMPYAAGNQGRHRMRHSFLQQGCSVRALRRNALSPSTLLVDSIGELAPHKPPTAKEDHYG